MDEDESTPVAWQYSAGGCVLTGGMHDEQDAMEAAAHTVDGTCVVAVIRAARGGWRFPDERDDRGPGDYGHAIPLTGYRERFRTPADALAYVTKRAGLTVHVVADFLDC